MNEGASEELPAGWVRDEGGALRRETIHSMLRRLPGEKVMTRFDATAMNRLC